MWTDIRKFGLEYCDLPTMLSNVSTMLKMLALNIDGKNDKHLSTVFIILTAISTICYIHAYIVSSVLFMIWFSKDKSNISNVFVAFSLTVTSSIAVIKLFYMMFYREKLKDLTNKYLDYDARIIQGSRFSDNMLKNLRNIKKRGAMYWWVLMVDALVYVLKPLLLPGRHLTLDAYVIYGLEPMLKSPNYEIAYIIMTISVLFICFTVANVTCFLIFITGYNEAQMLSLSVELTKLWDDAKLHYNYQMKKKLEKKAICYKKRDNYRTEPQILNIYIKEHLIEIIGRHSMIINNLQEVEDIMRGPNIIAFLFLMVGLIAELLGGFENTYLQLPFTMMQLAVDCYLGQKIMDSNEAFKRSVYDCKWELFNESNKRIVLLMLQTSQKTLTLTAGGMTTLNFNCLMVIIKNTYSAYTTLRSMV